MGEWSCKNTVVFWGPQNCHSTQGTLTLPTSSGAGRAVFSVFTILVYAWDLCFWYVLHDMSIWLLFFLRKYNYKGIYIVSCRSSHPKCDIGIVALETFLNKRQKHPGKSLSCHHATLACGFVFVASTGRSLPNMNSLKSQWFEEFL